MDKIKKATDLRGAAQLIIDSIKGITNLSEDLHQTIASVAGLLGKNQPHTKGITGFVYQNIRTVSGIVGGGLDAVLDQLHTLLGEKTSCPKREAVLSVVNGILGDYLEATKNPLAISMALRRNGKVLDLDDEDFSNLILKSSGKLVLMVHGSCMNDLQLRRQDHDHGAAIAKDLGYEPVYLHYNSGLHISDNGQSLSDLLEKFIQNLPPSLEIVIIAHSMGGLVSRSAIHYSQRAGHSWLNNLKKIVFLGAPHHGAPLERGGNWIDVLLEISPYSAPFSRLGKIRSSGVTDLRYGNIVDEDWKGRDRFELSGDHRRAVPLPENVKCYTIAATTAKKTNSITDSFGDGLVPLKSALGQHKNPDYHLLFPSEHQWIGRGMNHLDLLNHPEVYEVMRQWISN